MRVIIPAGHWITSFQPRSLGSGCCAGTQEVQLTVHHVGKWIEDAPVEKLEAHQMKMHGMHILGQVRELPDLGRVQLWRLRDRLVPAPCDSAA